MIIKKLLSKKLWYLMMNINNILENNKIRYVQLRLLKTK